MNYLRDNILFIQIKSLQWTLKVYYGKYNKPYIRKHSATFIVQVISMLKYNRFIKPSSLLFFFVELTQPKIQTL